MLPNPVHGKICPAALNLGSDFSVVHLFLRHPVLFFAQMSFNFLGQRQVNVVFLLQPEEDLDAPNPVEEQMLIVSSLISTP